jgi:hypothetical protein
MNRCVAQNRAGERNGVESLRHEQESGRWQWTQAERPARRQGTFCILAIFDNAACLRARKHMAFRD